MATTLLYSVCSLKTELKNIGKKLLSLPSSNSDLINVLQQVEQVLSRVQRLPPKSILRAMNPISKAMISKKLVRHANMDVNISVSCCICEILRISAPDVPYTDNQMKEFLDLAVVTFVKLSSACGGCYTRMTKFLAIFSNFRLPLLTSDLQLDGLVVRLFKQFLTNADFNSSATVHEMEEFMTMIIEESEVINLELVNLLVTSVRKNNQIISPVCYQLAENVIKNCYAQLKPHLPNMETKEIIPYTTEKSKFTKDITHKIKLEYREDIIDLSSDDSPISSKSVPDVNGKRKRNYSPENKQVMSYTAEHGENLVGSRIKVWWPEDKTYYQGVVKYFDCIERRHKILYDDDDEEFLDLKCERWELVENVSAMPDSVIQPQRKKVSSPQSGIICVHGYNVKHSVAPTLESIFKKHGDIAAKCVFKNTSVRASFLEVVCEVVRQIETNNFTKIEEIESEVSDAEAANINVSWLRAHLEATHKTLLMETKTNTILVEKAVQKDVKERLAELIIATRRFKNAERCVKVLNLVKKKVNENILESNGAKMTCG